MQHGPEIALTQNCTFPCDFVALGWQKALTSTRVAEAMTVRPRRLSSPFALGAGACFGQTRISVGKANKRLTYVDQVLQLVYEEGSPCPSKSALRYKSVFSFVCKPETGPSDRPVLISLDKQTCTLFFSWHTPLACEQAVSPELAGPRLSPWHTPRCPWAPLSTSQQITKRVSVAPWSR